MRSPELRRERAVVAGLLLLCVLCCGSVLVATTAAERANERRSNQLQLLAGSLERPELLPNGPIEVLDGLYGRSLRCIATIGGPVIAFDVTDNRSDA